MFNNALTAPNLKGIIFLVNPGNIARIVNLDSSKLELVR
jgi:hypothetical protein